MGLIKDDVMKKSMELLEEKRIDSVYRKKKIQMNRLFTALRKSAEYRFFQGNFLLKLPLLR